MTSAPQAKRSYRKTWLILAGLVVIVVMAAVVLHAAGYGFAGHQASSPADHQNPVQVEPPQTPAASQATMAPSSAAIPGLTVAAFQRKLPGSWKAKLALAPGTAGQVYTTTSSTALAGTHLLLNINLNGADKNAPLKSISCQLNATGLRPDSGSLGVLTGCLRAAMPPADAQRAVSWLNHTAVGLSGRADLRSFDTDGFTVYLEHSNLGGLVIIIRGAA